ncbi:unnamed protein product [Ranitomeya imitator]|uniref:Aquaporin 1 n=1 Tax=Ranitomeya imitator TaxID=111125 RepID=A0ABN9L0S8_9NEOB|nr:unnamed protein product [Ranitomeya imitator]
MILFVFISIGAALGVNFPIQDKSNETAGRTQDIVKVSLAFGLSIATMAQSVGHISGAHLNPAVTLGCLLSCQISILKAVMYIIAQCLGAVVATAILSGVTSNIEGNTLGLNGDEIGSNQALSTGYGMALHNGVIAFFIQNFIPFTLYLPCTPSLPAPKQNPRPSHYLHHA